MKKLMALAALAALAGCTGEIEIVGQGDVLADNGNHCYFENNGSCVETITEGFQRQLTAVPRDGWKFVAWEHCRRAVGNVCVMWADTETVKLGFGRKLPTMKAYFQEIYQPTTAYLVGNTFACQTDLPYDRHCPQRIGDELRIRANYEANQFSWAFSNGGVIGSSLIYTGDYSMTADGFTFTGVSGILNVVVVKSETEITISRRSAEWHVTQISTITSETPIN